MMFRMTRVVKYTIKYYALLYIVSAIHNARKMPFLSNPWYMVGGHFRLYIDSNDALSHQKVITKFHCLV